MAYYRASLVASLAVNAALAGFKQKATSPKRPSSIEDPEQSLRLSHRSREPDFDWSAADTNEWSVIARQYLSAYALAAGADWLQVSGQT